MKRILLNFSVASLVFTGLTAHSQSLTDSLIAYYPLDGDTKDYSGNGYDLTNSGATLTSNFKNEPNRAYKFNGSTSFMSNVADSELRPAEYSLSCWMKMDILPTSGNFSIAIDNGGLIKDNGLQVAHNYSGYNGIGAFSYKQTTQSNAFFVSTGLDTSTWQFYTITRSFDSITLYINGIRSGASPIGDFTGYSGGNLGFYLGNRHGTINHFDGKLDEVKLWKRPLSPAEVAQLYNTSLTSVQGFTEFNSDISIYPNPSTGNFHVKGSKNEPMIIQILNPLGQQIFESPINNEGETIFIEEKGFYVVRILNEEGKFLTAKKVVVQ